MKLIIFTALFILFLPTISHSQEIENIFDDWSVFTYDMDGKKVCYMVGKPKKSSGNFKNRGEPYMMVANYGDTIEVSVSSGYLYKEKSKVFLEFLGTQSKYTMFSGERTAWANSNEEDAEIIDKMKKASFVIIKGTSRKETTSSDKYSLKGFTKSLSEINNLCKS